MYQHEDREPFRLRQDITRRYPETMELDERTQITISCIYVNNQTLSKWFRQYQHVINPPFQKTAIPYHIHLIDECMQKIIELHNPSLSEFIETEDKLLSENKGLWDRHRIRWNWTNDANWNAYGELEIDQD